MVNTPSAKGSPLLLASQKGHVGLVNILLENQARVDTLDSEGKAALHLAAEFGFKPVSLCGLNLYCLICVLWLLSFSLKHFP